MNTKRLLRHLSIIMFLLFVGVFAQATQVSAKNVKNYSELCAAAKNKDVTTITVTGSIKLTGNVEFTGTKTLKPSSGSKLIYVYPGDSTNWIHVSGNLTLSGNLTIQGRNKGNTTSKALIWVDNGTLTMGDGVTLKGNTNTDKETAGAVWLDGKSTFNMKGGTITECKNIHVGGVNVSSRSTFNMSGGTIMGCTATGESKANGGGVNNHGTFNFTGGTIANNTSTGEGGGVYNTGTFNMSGSAELSHNSSKQEGGGLFSKGNNTTATITDGLIKGNWTDNGSGGGVGSYYGANLTIGSSSNTSRGGYPWFDQNTAKGSGGAIRGNGGSGGESCGNTYIYKGTFTDNTATDNGGAVSIYGRGSNAGKASNFICRYAVFERNESKNGGALDISTNVSVVESLTNSLMINNKSSENGGAINTASGLTVQAPMQFAYDTANNRAEGNYAVGKGGIIYATSGTLTLTGTSDSALYFEFGKSGSSGGGVYATESATVKINDNVNISRCRAGNTGCANRQNWNLGYGSVKDSNGNLLDANGGAMFIGKKLEIKSTNGSVNIYDNCASNGGAIYLTEKADLEIDANTNRNSNVYMNIFDNTAKHNGGAISTRGSISALKYVNLFRNLAQGEDNYAGNGGGIYKANGTYNNEVTGIQDIKLTYNKAKSLGGAIYNEGNVTSGNTVAINGSSAIYGSALYNVGSFNVSAFNAHDNGGTLTLKRVTETTNGTSNYKEHVEPSYDGSSVFTTDGAVYNTGSLSLSGAGKIQNNVAKSGGSAIFNNGTISNLNGTISGNSGCESVIYNCQYKSIVASVDDTNVLSITDNKGVNIWNYGSISVNGNSSDKTNFTIKNGTLYGEILNGVSSNSIAASFYVTGATVDIGSDTSSSKLYAINNARGRVTFKNCKGKITSNNGITVNNQSPSTFVYSGGGETVFTSSATNGTIVQNDGGASVGAGAYIFPMEKSEITTKYGIYNNTDATLTVAATIVGKQANYAGTMETGIYNQGELKQFAGTITSETKYGIDNKNLIEFCEGQINNCDTGLMNEYQGVNENKVTVIKKIITDFEKNKRALLSYGNVNSLGGNYKNNGADDVDGSAIYTFGNNAKVYIGDADTTTRYKNPIIAGNIAKDGTVYVGTGSKVTCDGQFNNSLANTAQRGGFAYIGMYGTLLHKKGKLPYGSAEKGSGVYIYSNGSIPKGSYQIMGDASLADGTDVYEDPYTYVEIVGELTGNDIFTITPSEDSTDNGRVIADVTYDGKNNNDITAKDSLYISGTMDDENNGLTVKKRFVSTGKYDVRCTDKLQNEGKINLFTGKDRADSNKNTSGYETNYTELKATNDSTNDAIILSEKYEVRYHTNLEKGVEVLNMPGTSELTDVEGSDCKVTGYGSNHTVSSLAKMEFTSSDGTTSAYTAYIADKPTFDGYDETYFKLVESTVRKKTSVTTNTSELSPGSNSEVDLPLNEETSNEYYTIRDGKVYANKTGIISMDLNVTGNAGGCFFICDNGEHASWNKDFSISGNSSGGYKTHTAFEYYVQKGDVLSLRTYSSTIQVTSGTISFSNMPGLEAQKSFQMKMGDAFFKPSQTTFYPLLDSWSSITYGTINSVDGNIHMSRWENQTISLDKGDIIGLYTTTEKYYASGSIELDFSILECNTSLATVYTEYKYWYEDYTMSDREPKARKHTFIKDKSWNESTDGEGTVHSLGSKYDDNNDLDVYAIWTSVIDSYEVQVYHFVMDTTGSYDKAKVYQLSKNTVNDYGMHTTVKVLENQKLTNMDNDTLNNYIDNQFVDEGYTKYSRYELENTNDDGTPKSDGTTKISIYYSRQAYKMALYGDDGVYNLYARGTSGMVGSATATGTARYDTYYGDESKDGREVLARTVYYATRKGTDIYFRAQLKKNTTLEGFHLCRDEGLNIYGPKMSYTDEGNRTYVMIRSTVYASDIQVVVKTYKDGPVTVRYALENRNNDNYTVIEGKNTTINSSGNKIDVNSLLNNKYIPTDGSLYYGYLLYTNEESGGSSNEKKKLTDDFVVHRGDTITIVIERKKYTATFIPGDRAVYTQSWVNDNEDDYTKEYDKLGTTCVQTVKAYVPDAKSRFGLTDEKPDVIHAKGLSEKKSKCVWYDVSDVSTVDDSTIALSKSENSTYKETDSDSLDVTMNNSSVKYLYSHKPTFASIEFQHYLMNGNHNYDSLPSKTIKMTNMSMDDAHFNVKDNVWTDYIDNDGYELDKVEIGNKTYDPDDINQSIDVENTDTVYVKYYYKMKKIKVKFYIDDNFESLTMNTGEKDEKKYSFNSETNATRNIETPVHEMEIYDGDTIKFTPKINSSFNKKGYTLGTGFYFASYPNENDGNGWQLETDGTNESIKLDMSKDNPITQAIAKYGYLPVWIFSDNKPILYTVKYNVNCPAGESAYTGHMDDSIMEYDREQDLTENDYALKGYKFKGWATESTKDKNEVVYKDNETVLNLTDKAGDVINLYAVWQKVTKIKANMMIENKFFPVGYDLNFDKLFKNAIITDGKGNLIDLRSAGLEIIEVSKVIGNWQDDSRVPIYPDDNAYDVADDAIEEKDIPKYISTEKEGKYLVTVRAHDFNEDGQPDQEMRATFRVTIWAMHRTERYVRAIDKYALDTIPADSKWAAGELGAELIASMNKSGYSQAKYVYRIMYTDVDKIREKLKDNKYYYKNIRGWFKENIKPVIAPDYFYEQRSQY